MTSQERDNQKNRKHEYNSRTTDRAVDEITDKSDRNTNYYEDKKTNFHDDKNVYSGDKNDYSNDRGNYSNDRNNYSNDRGNYSNDRNNYSNDRGNYNNDRGNYSNERRNYSNDRNNNRNDYSNDRGNYSRDYDDRNNYSRDYDDEYRDNYRGNKNRDRDRERERERDRNRNRNRNREETDAAYEEYQQELRPYEKKEDDNCKEDVEPICDFEQMGLNENLFRGIISYGFERPTTVQQYAIQLFTKDKDMIIQSQAGTGKTATFLIGALNKINEAENGCQVIIIAPTRELAKQIQTVAIHLSCYTKINIVLCTKEKILVTHNEIRNKTQNAPCIVIATPGKLCYFLKRKIINAHKLKLLIMDEADQLLSKDFISTIQEIYSMTPDTSKTCLFSATMSEGFIKITKNFMREPLIRILKPEELTLEGIKQYYYWVKNNDRKFYYLLDIYDKLSISQSIIYVNSANMAKDLQYRLNEEKFTTSIIYGALSVEERNNVMKNFRSGKSRILISTDLLSRGIDIQQIAVVINYELPFDNQLDSYLHRIGRSGRFGRKGTAINFVTDRDKYKIDKIEKLYLTNINKMPNNIEEVL